MFPGKVPPLPCNNLLTFHREGKRQRYGLTLWYYSLRIQAIKREERGSYINDILIISTSSLFSLLNRGGGASKAI